MHSIKLFIVKCITSKKGGCTMETNNFYLSRILGNKVYTPDMKVIGRIKDFGVINELKSPNVVAKVKTK